jgi:putative sterol carrier protein
MGSAKHFERIDSLLKAHPEVTGPTFHFVVGNEQWTVNISGSPSRGVQKGLVGKAEACLRLGPEDFSDMVSGARAADDLFRAGKLKIEGNIMKALFLKKVFGMISPPSAASYVNSEEKETTPVRSNHKFDEAALERYLIANIPGFTGPLAIKQFNVQHS